MNRHGDADRLLDLLRNLGAKHVGGLAATAPAGEQPRSVTTSEQHRPVLVHILVDQLSQPAVKLEFQRNVVLHVIVGEDEPIGVTWPARFDQILAQPAGSPDSLAGPAQR
jgi:hypothetical protein